MKRHAQVPTPASSGGQKTGLRSGLRFSARHGTWVDTAMHGDIESDFGSVQNGGRNLSVAGTSFDGTSFDGTSFDGSSFDGSSLDGTSFDGSSLDGSSLDGSSLDGTSLDGTSLDGTSLDGTSFGGTSSVASTARSGVFFSKEHGTWMIANDLLESYGLTPPSASASASRPATTIVSMGGDSATYEAYAEDDDQHKQMHYSETLGTWVY